MQALTRAQFTAELSLLTFTGLTGDPSLNLRLGVFLPRLRTTLFAGGNTPYALSDLATESLFDTGEDLDVYWDGEIQAGARFHVTGRRYTGPYVETALGYEAFEVRPRGTDRDAAQASELTNTVDNGFLGLGLGYTVHLFSDLATLNVGGRAVILFGGQDDEVAGGVPIDYSWGFLTPEFRLGVRL